MRWHTCEDGILDAEEEADGPLDDVPGKMTVSASRTGPVRVIQRQSVGSTTVSPRARMIFTRAATASRISTDLFLLRHDSAA